MALWVALFLKHMAFVYLVNHGMSETVGKRIYRHYRPRGIGVLQGPIRGPIVGFRLHFRPFWNHSIEASLEDVLTEPPTTSL